MSRPKTVKIAGRELPLLSAKEAKERGFTVITKEMSPRADEHVLAAVLRDLETADCETCLVRFPNPCPGSTTAWAAVARTRFQTTAETQRRENRRTLQHLRNMLLGSEPSAA